MLGDTRGAPALPVAAALAVADPLGDLVASSDPRPCEPPSASAVMTPVAAIKISMADAAARSDSARIRPLGCLTCCGKPLGPNGPARCVTSSRYACASGL